VISSNFRVCTILCRAAATQRKNCNSWQ